MRTRAPLALAWSALLLALPHSAYGQTCANIPQTYPLLAGTTPVGTVTVSNDLKHVYVTYTVNSSYVLDLSNVHVADSAAGIPLTSNGNPNTSRFTYRTTNQPGVTSFTYTVPNRWQVNTLVYLAANAKVQQVLASCNSGDGSEGDDDHHDGEDHQGDGSHHSSSVRHDSHDGCVVRQTTCGAGSGSDDEDARSQERSATGYDGSESDDDGHRSSQCCGPQQVAWAGNRPLGNGFYFLYFVNCGLLE